MKIGRRIGAVVATSAAAVGMASVMAAPATAAPAARGPQVISPWLQTVDSGESEWVSVWLRGVDRRICDVRMAVRGPRNVDIDYPGNRNYTSLNGGSTLVRGERDRASFRVEANVRRDSRIILSGVVSYNDCGRFSRTQFKRFGLLLPVDADHRGPGHGHGGPGHGGPGHGGPGHGGPGHGGPGHGGPGHGGPGHGGPGTGR
jgi:hypothetical protein